MYCAIPQLIELWKEFSVFDIMITFMIVILKNLFYKKYF